MRRPLEDIRIFKDRRQQLASKISGCALIVAAHPEQSRNSDVFYPYRQDSNMYYLTGFEEPESILLFRPGLIPETVLFVRRRDPERETWDGFRYGPEGVETHFGVDKAYPIDEFEKLAPEMLKGIEVLQYRLFKNREMDIKMERVLLETRRMQGRTGYGLLTIQDADMVIGEMRLIKSEKELLHQRQACEISVQGHLAAMEFVRPGVTERQVQAVLTKTFYMQDSAREGYNFIVASGNSATTLHYNFNDQKCAEGDLLLIDAGAEYKYYTGDITRTFPVNGKFTQAQREIYQGVLDVQKAILNYIHPGLVFKDLHEMGTDLLTQLMLDLGLLEGRKEDIIKSNGHRKFYPHGIGHWLGMDVHDAGLYFQKGVPRPIEPNMCFTVEPGLYIPHNDTTVPEKYRGIGVRIEDNLRVTTTGCEVMTSGAPKEIADLESLIGRTAHQRT